METERVQGIAVAEIGGALQLIVLSEAGELQRFSTGSCTATPALALADSSSDSVAPAGAAPASGRGCCAVWNPALGFFLALVLVAAL